MNTIDIMDCGEISCEYCTKDKCIYMSYGDDKENEE